MSVASPEGGGLLRYTCCTPDFVIGTTMVEARPTRLRSPARVSVEGSQLFANGHPVLLRGVNVSAYSDDDSDEVAEVLALTSESDYQAIAKAGFNVVRLNLWSKAFDGESGWAWLGETWKTFSNKIESTASSGAGTPSLGGRWTTAHGDVTTREGWRPSQCFKSPAEMIHNAVAGQFQGLIFLFVPSSPLPGGHPTRSP